MASYATYRISPNQSVTFTSAGRSAVELDFRAQVRRCQAKPRFAAPGQWANVLGYRGPARPYDLRLHLFFDLRLVKTPQQSEQVVRLLQDAGYVQVAGRRRVLKVPPTHVVCQLAPATLGIDAPTAWLISVTLSEIQGDRCPR